ncbi:hypothetical protein [Deinococcus sp. ME38]|uniref:hypothetical protein n=1 Tax=Deinococcus sp. ME38 TaxID=3400344 RepID=UPI003B59F9A9
MGNHVKGERDAARVYLQEVRGSLPDLPDIADWKTLTPAQRFQIAQAGEDLAGAFGLTFHEWLSLKASPAAPITAAGLRRLQASPQEKAHRAQRRSDATYRRDLERQCR